MARAKCAWCGADMGERPGPDGMVTHGICPDCAAKIKHRRRRRRQQPAPNQTALDISDRVAVRQAVRDFLLERGEAGATTSELVQRFGMSAVKRLNDLRKDPTELWDYRGDRISRTEHRYWLVKKPQERWPVLEPASRPGLLF